MEIAVAVEVNVAPVFAWSSVGRGDEAVDLDLLTRSGRNLEVGVDVFSNVLFLWVVVVDIEADDVFLTILDGDVRGVPDIIFAFSVWAVVLTGGNEVLLVAVDAVAD